MKSNKAESHVYENGQVLREGPNYVKEKKNSIKQLWIMRPNACALPLVSETIFRDGNGGKSKSLKVEVHWPFAAPSRPLKLKAFSKSQV